MEYNDNNLSKIVTDNYYIKDFVKNYMGKVLLTVSMYIINIGGWSGWDGIKKY